jgi:hypothetical protein
MATSDANTTNLAYCEETTYGALPTSPEFKTIRLTGETLAHAKETIQSQEIRSDRQVPDLVKVGSSATGNVNFELSFAEYLPFIEAVLCSSFDDITLTDVSGSIDKDAHTFTAGTPGAVASLPEGGFVKVASATLVNNGIKRVLTNDGTVLTFAPGSFSANTSGQNATFTTSDLRNGLERRSYTIEREVINSEGTKLYQSYPGCYVGMMDLRVESKQIVTGSFGVMGKFGQASLSTLNTNGALAATGTLTLVANPSDGDTVTIGARTYTFQDTLTNVAGNVQIDTDADGTLDNLIAAINFSSGGGSAYAAATTVHPTVTAAAGAGDTMTVTAKATGTGGNAIVTTETFTNSGNVFGAATLTGGANPSYEASEDGDVLNGTSNLGTIQGSAGTFQDKMRVLAFSINNNLRGKDALGEEGNFEIGLGTFSVTGNISAYFADNTLYQALIDHDDNALAFTLQDSDGNVIAFTFPRIKWGAGNPNATAINTDIMLDIDFTAIRDRESGVTMIVNKFPAA